MAGSATLRLFAAGSLSARSDHADRRPYVRRGLRRVAAGGSEVDVDGDAKDSDDLCWVSIG